MLLLESFLKRGHMKIPLYDTMELNRFINTLRSLENRQIFPIKVVFCCFMEFTSQVIFEMALN